MPSSAQILEAYTMSVPSDALQAKLLDKVIPKRRGPTASVPGLSLAEGLLMGDDIMARFDLTEYQRHVTAEMRSRPIPHVFRTEELKPLNDLFTEYYPHVMAWIIPQLRAPYITFNKVSKVGYPGFFIPPNKQDYVSMFMPSVLAGDLDLFKEGFITMNVRLQVDQASKERDFMFCGDREIYLRTITYKDKLMKTPVGLRAASRTRLVFNYPVYNLIKQVLDSAIGDVFNRWPAFHHNMFGGDLLPVKGHHVCLDIKHFERHTATCNRIRAKMWGGVYGMCSDVSSSLPFAVPTDDWKGARFLHVNREEGWSDQYGSGDSAVAPSQKEIMMCVYVSFFEQELGYTRAEAIKQVALGGDHRLTIRNFGDDNSIDGDKAVVLAFMDYASQFLHVEEETPPKFLGFVWYDGMGWKLPISSYVTKTYLNERRPGSNFRKYPFLGWLERRAIFSKLGHPMSSQVIETENQELTKLGLPWSRVLDIAEKERRDAFLAKETGAVDPLVLQDKEYLMTPLQRVSTGNYTGLGPDSTHRILTQLVSKTIASQLTL